MIIASPEYNSSITPLLKNTLDRVSRPAPNESTLAAFQGKVMSLVSASPGALGGWLVHLRAILGNIGVLVLPEQIAVPKAHEAFDSDGSLKDATLHSSIRQNRKETRRNREKARVVGWRPRWHDFWGGTNTPTTASILVPWSNRLENFIPYGSALQ
ncbi:MAG: NAD(P)H-dependent oxidoreductase [Planctomycetota bacterium]